jgi:catechol 2,3-dioxygenase-like lactoylglutathione lyase family enzyme
MSLHRLVGFTAGVPDPDGLAAFYGELGLASPAPATFTGSAGGATVTLQEAPFRRLLGVTIGCDDPRDLDAIARRLGEGGATIGRGDDVVTVRDPASHVALTVALAPPEAAPSHACPSVAANAPGAVVRRNERAPAVFDRPRPPVRLGHLVIGTPDLAATRSLLVDALGCKVSDELPGIISFLRCSTDHHNVAVVASPVPMLQHYSWECDDLGHAATALLRTDPGRHCWGIGRHFAGSNYYWYLRDPSGSFLELYADLDRIDDDEAWEAQRRGPLAFEHVANAWGPNLPPEFVAPADLPELEAAWARWA